MIDIYNTDTDVLTYNRTKSSLENAEHIEDKLVSK